MIKDGYRNYDSPVAMPDLGQKEFTLDEYYFMINKNNSLKDEKLSVMKDAIDKLNNIGLKVNKLTVSQYSGVSRNTVNKRWKELIKYTS
jgi:hypothetical protein